MKPVTVIIMLTAYCYGNGFSQQECNLIRNWSFEQYDTCPTISSHDISLANYWFSPSFTTPDYFNVCGDNYYTIPANTAGITSALTGFAYGGIVLFGISANYREYISIRLTNALLQNKVYGISFFIKRGDYSKYAVNSFGVYFSDSIYSSNYCLPYTPQFLFDSTSTIKNSNAWVKISGQYQAQGGEEFITIGNFYPDSSTALLVDSALGSDPIAYYYIDDVSVVCCDSSGTCELLDTTVTPILYPNPNNGEFTFNYYLKPNTSGTVYIYNMLGQIVFTEYLPKNVTTKNYVLPNLASGIYYFIAKEEEGVFYETKFVVVK